MRAAVYLCVVLIIIATAFNSAATVLPCEDTAVIDVGAIPLPKSAGALAQYTITFNANRSLAPCVDRITITFPERTVVPDDISHQHVTVNDVPLNADGIAVEGNTVCVTTPVRCAASGKVRVDFAEAVGIRNPWLSSHADDNTKYKVKVSTTKDRRRVASDYYVIDDWIEAHPMQLSLQQEVEVTGGGFKPGASVNLVASGGAVIPDPEEVHADGTFEIIAYATGLGAPITAEDCSGREAQTVDCVIVLPRLTITPENGNTGASVEIAGYDFTGVPIDLSFGDVSIDVSNITLQDLDNDGQLDDFKLQTTVPPGLESGEVLVSATDTDGHTASAEFTVTSQTLSIDPSSGPKGFEVTVNGTGFAPNGTICEGDLMFGEIGWNPGAITIDSSGEFSVSLMILSEFNEGQNAVSVTDSEGISASTVFEVIKPTLEFDKDTGSCQILVNITGERWLPGGSGLVTIHIGGEIMGVITPDETGEIQGALGIPCSLIPGEPYDYWGEDTYGNVSSKGIFVVTGLSFVVSPDSGSPGTSITIKGEGFPPLTDVQSVTMDEIDLICPVVVSTTNNGLFAVDAVVPGLFSGTYTITAKVETETSVPFYITDSIAGADNLSPSISVEPESGQPGDTIIITGTGFLPYVLILYVEIGGITLVPCGILTDSSGAFVVSAIVPQLAENSYAIVAGVAGELEGVSSMFAIEDLAPDISVCRNTELTDEIFIEAGVRCSDEDACNLELLYSDVDTSVPGNYSYIVTCCDQSLDGIVSVVDCCQATAPNFRVPVGTELTDQIFIDQGVECAGECIVNLDYSEVVTSVPGDYSYMVSCDRNPTPITGTNSHSIETGPVIGVGTVSVIKVFSVVFNAESGGNLSGDTSQNIFKGDDCTEVVALANTGYRFTGWRIDSGYWNGTFSDPGQAGLKITDITGNISVSATFHRQGGSSYGGNGGYTPVQTPSPSPTVTPTPVPTSPIPTPPPPPVLPPKPSPSPSIPSIQPPEKNT